jgi:hypothetical protein
MSVVSEITGNTEKVETRNRPFEAILGDITSHFEEGAELVTIVKQSGPNFEVDNQDFETLDGDQLKAMVATALNV